MFLSCATEKNPYHEVENIGSTADPVVADTLWICHHPGTDQHGELCVEEEYPAGCYVGGDSTKFCWQLLKDDCVGTPEQDWQIENCHYFNQKI